ncbi:impB/mucB/samB family protein [Thalassovita taeanensis]|uniref:ImpB/mucB/samB family protein n=1 Tax=Thalassovita taeanensis TaxID=657014 RepID=A0A1H9ENY4_9RHOB|nr:impB/mucB/samB family protein [Thalassovita taeanensis]
MSLWFPRLPSDRVLRARPTDAPFALTLHQKNTDRIYCLNQQAEQQGLHRGMGYSDARAFCPDLQSRPADTRADLRFLHMLARWAKRYCPWVGLDDADGLLLNITGAAHLFGGEAAMLDDMRHRLARAGVTVRIGLADTRGAAWALAHFREGYAKTGHTQARLTPLPIAALRLDDKTRIALQRIGIQRISDLIALPRTTVTRRFGPDVLMRLDQALGRQPEQIFTDAPLTPHGPHSGQN